MPAQPPEPSAEEEARARVEEFAQSIHASYLSRWRSHDPKALQQLSEEASAERRRKKRTSAA